jgi:hypothetical protein
LLSPDIINISHTTHYLMAYPKDEREVRKVVVVAGTCNRVSFEAIAKNDPDFSASLSLFREDGDQFSKIEFQSIRRRIIGAKSMETFDLRAVPEEKGYEYYYDQMHEKYYGQKVYLNVPFGRKDEAKALGAKWDNLLKKWFTFSNSPNLLKIEKYFIRDKS